MKAFACKPLKLSSNKVLVLGSIKGAKEPILLPEKSMFMNLCIYCNLLCFNFYLSNLQQFDIKPATRMINLKDVKKEDN